MAKLSIEQTHKLPHEEVRKRLEDLAARLSEKYGIDARWTSEREATVKRTGVSGTIQCGEGKVTVTLDLSFALLPLKGKIDERIRKELATTLA
jgi:putative polyhydroxyalkanoate system protein